MENTNIVQSKTSLRKIIFMMISILTLVLLINLVYISFSQAIIVDGGSSGCTSCCTNECSPGTKRCNSTTGYQTCVSNYDSDSCYEWGAVSTCSGSTACDYGTCSSSQKPQWYCSGAGTCTYTCYTSSSCQPSCTNECSYSGQKRCSGTATVQTCGNYDSDTCLEWGNSSTCSGSTSCGYGSCSSSQRPQWYCSGSGTCTYSCYSDYTCQPSCTNECSYSGQTECAGNAVRTCGNYDSDSCLEWGLSNACSGSTSCGYGSCADTQRPQWLCSGGSCTYSCYSDSSCGPTCTNECVSGSKRCWGSNSYQTCSDHNSDGCTDWSSPVLCPSGQCSNGSCTCGSSCCTNECSYSGQNECYGNGVRTCGNYDSDTCLEWGTVSTCSGSTSCGYGTCSSSQRPQWYCSGGSCTYSCYNDSSCGPTCTNDCSYSGQKQCLNDNSYQTCGNYDSDTCLEWGATTNCPSDTCVGTTLRQYHCNCGSSCGSGCSYTDIPNSPSCGYTNPVSVSCSGSPNPAEIGQTVSFTSSVSGGSGSYTYSWTGDCTGTSQNCSQLYSSSGIKTTTIYVTSGSQSGYANCSVTVQQSCPTCTNECSYSGQNECYGNGVRTCGNYDSDTCLEWGTVSTCSGSTSCGYGTCSSSQRPQWYCSGGSCTYSCYSDSSCQPSCTNECSYSGQNECVGNAVRTCGNYDSDTCLEWGTTSTCSGDTSCDYGTCASNQRPQWYCSGGSCTYSCYNDSSCGCGYTCNTLGCYDNDVWYLNYLGQPQNRYQDCGDNHCDNFNQAYCYNGDVYRSRTCYNKGCSGSSCYSYTNTEQQLYQDCLGNQTCSNGQCVSQCECTSGACCDGCHYKTNATICNTESEVEYSCPWGTGCGSDVGKRLRTKYQYCSGTSATCSGTWSNWGSWTTWLTADYCSSGEGCSAGNQTCVYKTSCNQTLTKGCYNNDVYWFDASGNMGAKYKSCDDSNTCTLDGCSTGKCTNTLKCDGTTCAKDSKDYCDNCEHCGDGICGCEETPCSCAADCKTTTMSVSLLGKISGEVGDWQQSISTTPDTTLEFLLIFANNGDSDLSNVVLTAAIPSEITPNNDIKIDGIPYGGDIRTGVTLTQAASKGIKTITFSGKIAKAGSIDLSKTDIGFTAQAVAQNISVTDYIGIALSGAKGTSLGTASISEILRGWLFWLALILVCITLLAVGIFYLLFWLIRQRRQKITFQNQEVTLR